MSEEKKYTKTEEICEEIVVRHIRWSRIRQIKRSCLMAS